MTNVLAELETLLESCGGFEAIDEFGLVISNSDEDNESTWHYDASSRAF